MLKKIISPFQKVLLSRRLCVGCTHPLDQSKIRVALNDKRTLVQCKCKRRYILDRETNMYRRATFQEDYEYLNKIEKK